MNALSSNSLFDEGNSSWKLCGFYYLLFVAFIILDISNVGFLMSPMNFSFIPLMLFMGAIKFPSFVTPFIGFSAGIITDILSYTPIGLMGLMYFLTVFICRWQHRFILAQPFYIIWLFFSGYFSLLYVSVWAFQSAHNLYLFDIKPEVFIVIYGVIFFPILWGLLFKARSILSSSQENI